MKFSVIIVRKVSEARVSGRSLFFYKVTIITLCLKEYRLGFWNLLFSRYECSDPVQASNHDIPQGHAIGVSVHGKDSRRCGHGARFSPRSTIHIPRGSEARKKSCKQELRPRRLPNHQETNVQGRDSGFGNTSHLRANGYFKTVIQ